MFLVYFESYGFVYSGPTHSLFPDTADFWAEVRLFFLTHSYKQVMRYAIPQHRSKTSKVLCGMPGTLHNTAFEQIDGFQISLSLLNLTLYNGGNHMDKIRKFRILEQDTILEWKSCLYSRIFFWIWCWPETLLKLKGKSWVVVISCPPPPFFKMPCHFKGKKIFFKGEKKQGKKNNLLQILSMDKLLNWLIEIILYK